MCVVSPKLRLCASDINSPLCELQPKYLVLQIMRRHIYIACVTVTWWTLAHELCFFLLSQLKFNILGTQVYLAMKKSYIPCGDSFASFSFGVPFIPVGSHSTKVKRASARSWVALEQGQYPQVIGIWCLMFLSYSMSQGQKPCRPQSTDHRMRTFCAAVPNNDKSRLPLNLLAPR